MVNSATLSHLFAQGSVSAALLQGDAKYRAAVTEHFSKRWPTATFTHVPASAVRFVYAIITPRCGALADELFFFSAVNLLQHARDVEQRGFRVAVCKVNDATDPAVLRARRAKRKSKTKLLAQTP